MIIHNPIQLVRKATIKCVLALSTNGFLEIAQLVPTLTGHNPALFNEIFRNR